MALGTGQSKFPVSKLDVNFTLTYTQSDLISLSQLPPRQLLKITQHQNINTSIFPMKNNLNIHGYCSYL